MVRSPVDICLGTSPSQAAKSRPFVNASPLPIAATIALEMIGPIPGTLIKRSQPASRRPHIFGWHQPSVVAKRCEFAAEVMCANAGLHADETRRHGGKPG